MSADGIEGRVESKAERDARADKGFEAKWEARRKHALAQKLGLVQLSARRYGVIRIDSLTGAFISSLYGGESGSFHSLIGVSLVFGPAPYEECKAYIVQNADPLPNELSPQY
jgi:hypothetical protein